MFLDTRDTSSALIHLLSARLSVPRFAPEVAWVEVAVMTESVHAIKDTLEKIVL